MADGPKFIRERSGKWQTMTVSADLKESSITVEPSSKLKC